MNTHERAPATHDKPQNPSEDTPSTPEHLHENPPPFELRLLEEDRNAFASLAKKIGLPNMICAIKPIVTLKERRGTTFSEQELAVIDRLAAETAHIGVDVDPKFRWVSANAGVSVEALQESAHTTGGANPGDPWTHIGEGVVGDFMAEYSSSSGSGVLFVYDGAQLVHPTEEMIAAEAAKPDGKRSIMYAATARPGLELKDTVIGTVSFSSPSK